MDPNLMSDQIPEPTPTTTPLAVQPSEQPPLFQQQQQALIEQSTSINPTPRRYKRHFSMLEIFLIAGAVSVALLMTSLLLTAGKKYMG